MLTQIEFLQEHTKGICGVFRVVEGSSSGYLRSGENQGWNYYKGEEQRRYYQDWAKQSDYWKREEDHEEDHTHSSEIPKSRGSASSSRVNDLLSRILDKVEGLDDLLKRIKTDFSSLNNKVNSHSDAIKILEGQLSSLSTQLKLKMIMKNDDRELAVVTRSGNVAIGDVTGNEEAQVHQEDKGMEEDEAPIHQSITKGP
uniref:Integrase core domain containing protein n=1 Tax=Solanum tuberosum TaxID=4113 RepID=M1DTJ4_SOLTU